MPGKGTYIRRFGTDNVKTGSPFAVNDHVRIASITKTFTATAVLELVDRGRLSLSAHLSSFVKGVLARALATGALLTRRTRAERLHTVPLGGVPGKISLRYGLGILNVNGFIGHNGAILGYGTAMFYLPSAHATFVVEGKNNNLTSTVPTDIFIQLAAYLFPQRFANGI